MGQDNTNKGSADVDLELISAKQEIAVLKGKMEVMDRCNDILENSNKVRDKQIDKLIEEFHHTNDNTINKKICLFLTGVFTIIIVVMVISYFFGTYESIENGNSSWNYNYNENVNRSGEIGKKGETIKLDVNDVGEVDLNNIDFNGLKEDTVENIKNVLSSDLSDSVKKEIIRDLINVDKSGINNKQSLNLNLNNN